MNERYAQLLRRFGSVQSCLSGPELDAVYYLIYEFAPNGYATLNEEIEDKKLDTLERICISGEERKKVGFHNFAFGTAIDRLINRGLRGAAQERRVNFEEMLEFRKRFFNEETGKIDDEIKRKVIQSGMNAGRIKTGNTRYFYTRSRVRTGDKRQWIKEQYEESFKRFEEYLAGIKKDA